MAIPILIGAAVSAIGGVLGQLFASADRAQQEVLLQQAMNEFGEIDLPKLQDLVAEKLGDSSLADVKTDPRLKDAQYGYLSRLKEQYDNGGFDLEDRAAANRTTARTGRTARSAINSIQEGMDARGMGHSSSAVVLQAKAAQDAAQRASDEGLDLAAQARRRRFEALREEGDSAGKIRAQEYGEQARLAEARDRIATQNAEARRYAAQYNNTMRQNQFNNQMAKASAKAGLVRGQADYYGDRAQQTGNMAAGVGAAAGQAVNQYGTMENENEQRDLDRKAGYSRRNPFGGYGTYDPNEEDGAYS